MQGENHEGYKATDLYTRWLPAYDTETYAEKVRLCKQALRWWGDELHHATKRGAAVMTSEASQRWRTRVGWCQSNVTRWRNSLRHVMIQEGTMHGDVIPRY